ncbi:MAG TPA: diacylglycerol kinase family protein [Acidobacteriaceae bacterium]|nr:diacylglycerol kinase family protein [Acidobacteriaceae bacterium]
MRRAVLIFNPNAGRGGRSRIAALERAADVLRREDIQADIVATLGPGTAAVQAAGAAASGAELVFACGGDGTLHEVVQGLAHHPSAIVGVIPLGSANALARHLGLSFDAAEAMRQQLAFEPRSIPLGRITCETTAGQRSRFFAVMAGAGPDGMLVYRMLAQGKHRLGRAMYYVRAARLFMSERFAGFPLVAQLADGTSQERKAVSAMAIRVGDLGGLFSPLIRGASPADETLQLTVTEPPHRFTLPAWFATSWTRTHRWNPYTQHLRVTSFACAAAGQRIHVQADGEWIGTTPMQVELVPNALQLLMPASRSTSPSGQ